MDSGGSDGRYHMSENQGFVGGCGLGINGR